jgi:DNA-directed RNA polymerase subunit omega
MARITVEDCLAHERNRFALVQLAAKRTKQLLHGGKVLIPDARGNKAVVVSLREIADGLVYLMSHEELRKRSEDAALKQKEALADRANALLGSVSGGSVDPRADGKTTDGKTLSTTEQSSSVARDNLAQDELSEPLSPNAA